MASLAIHHTRTLFPRLALPWQMNAMSAALLPAALAPAPLSWLHTGLQSLLELFPPFLLAVPKKKVSHSRKSMRSADKGLVDKQNIVNCPACGMPKLSHHLCQECYGSLSRQWKMEKHTENAAKEREALVMAAAKGIKPAPPKTSSSDGRNHHPIVVSKNFKKAS